MTKSSSHGSSFKQFSSTMPKAIGKRMSDEDREIDIRLASSHGKSDDVQGSIKNQDVGVRANFGSSFNGKHMKFNLDHFQRDFPTDFMDVPHEIKTLNTHKTPDELVKELNMLKFANKPNEQVHLAVLYSSPLGYEEADNKGGIKFKSLQELSFEKDIERITSSIENSNKLVNYSINIGTPINLISALSMNPYILHFIGHGIKTSHFYKKEDYLVLENDDGSGQLVSSTKLKMIIDVCNTKLDTVFLSS